MLDPTFIISLLALGIAVGFLAGLLGIGGGAVMVPILSSLFLAQGVAIEHVMHLALGTSLASIIFSSLASFYAHHRRGGVDWGVVKNIAPGVVLGVAVTTTIVGLLNTLVLSIGFSVFIVYVAIKMFHDNPPHARKALPGPLGLFLVGSGIGSLSTMVSIGGGSISVPFLVSRNVPLKRAIGTSAALGFPIAIFGASGYWILGRFFHTTELGFVYFPAVLLISIMSVTFAPLGVKLAYKIPKKLLKRIFAVLLLILAARMVAIIMMA